MKLTPREVAQLEAALDEDQPTDTDRETELAQALKDDASTGHRFGAWKASQRICKAAGLPY